MFEPKGTVTGGIEYAPPIGEFAAMLHRINFIMWDQDLKKMSTAVGKAIFDTADKSMK
jgi:hypothetical protein